MSPGNKDALSLLLISFLGLFYELAFIRWLPANVLSLAYFSNIVLISCFLGFGLGCLLTRKKDLFRFFPVLLLAAVSVFLAFRWLEVVVPSEPSEWIWSSGSSKLHPFRFKLGILPAIAAVFSINAVLFVPIGQKMGSLMERFSPLKAYSLNILGSLLGVAAFGAVSFIGGGLSSPLFWFALTGLLALWFFLQEKIVFFTALLAAVLTCLLVGLSSRGSTWSPYYSIQVRPHEGNSHILYVNNFYHQKATDFDRDIKALEKYGLPYRLKNPKRVLILGAGSGNDAAVALRQGVGEIEAVEIDPVIARMGKELHPERPYQNPNVRLIVNDARSYLKKTARKYDMIVFGTLDSHALLSGMSTVRLDNFVYTLESLQDARRLLTDDGVVVLMFWVPAQWMADKLLDMTFEAFGQLPVLVHLSDSVYRMMIVAGPGVEKAWREFSGDRSQFVLVSRAGTAENVPTDDWPYLYLAKPAVPAYYLKAIAVLAALSVLAVLWAAPESGRRFDFNFFSLGCAFMLLETKSVTTLSLLYGSTWLVNAFVFGTILLMILLANWVVLKTEIKKVEWVYLGIGLSLLLNYLLPTGLFLQQGFWVRSLASSFHIALPLFFAGILFARLFRSVSGVGAVFGANLIGAVLGGFLEYSSMRIGFNNLYLVAGFFYLLSFFLTRRKARAGAVRLLS